MFAGTYEEFETGPWHGTSAQPKQSWGGIPDIWFTSEVLVGLRHFLGLAAFKRNAFLKDVMCGLQNLMRDLFITEEETTGSLSLWHGAPSEWRAGDALTIRRMPTSFGVRLSVAARWGSAHSSFSLTIHGTEEEEEGGLRASAALQRVRLHVGSCASVVLGAAGGAEAVAGARCAGGVAELELAQAGQGVVEVAVEH